MPKTQVCLECGIEKPVESFEWQKNRPNPRKRCKSCRHKARDFSKEYEYRRKKKKEKYWEDPAAARRIWERSVYGICKEDFKYDVCWICGSSHRLSIDHCHASEKVRGLLCGRCNSALGFFKDDVENLKKAIEYLEYGETHYQLSRRSYP